ncbi:MAG: lipopolysaccharide biosynthesis protein [Bacteroidetes bacterium]|nr:lipopolysaccharide biosynthesis protein [Bacteroidota bacterium]
METTQGGWPDRFRRPAGESYPGDRAIETLKTKAFRGSVMLGGANVFLRVVTMVASILLTRRLTAVEFGFVDMAMIALTTTNLFAGLGLPMAVIQSQADRRKVAYQSFVVTASIGFVLMILVYLFATPIADLLGNETAGVVLRWLSPLVLFGGLSMIPEAILQKDLLFGRVSIISVVTELVYIGIALWLAYTGFGVWSLVYALLVRSALSVALNWGLCPGWDWITPRPWDSKLLRELLGFGVTAAGGGAITFVYGMVDGFTISRWLGPGALGVYQRAVGFTSRTIDGINRVLGAVLMPSYALIQDERERLSRAYLKSLRLIACIIVPAAMGMLILAPEMITTLLTEEWYSMLVPFQILCVASTVRPLSATTSALFTSTGRPGYNFRAGLVVLGALVPAIALLLPQGITGVALAVLISQVIGFGYNMYQMRLVLPGTGSRMIPAIAPAAGAALAMMAIVHLAKAPVASLTGVGNAGIALGILCAVGALTYAGVLVLIQRPLVMEVLGLAFKRFRPPSDR